MVRAVMDGGSFRVFWEVGVGLNSSPALPA